MSVNIFERLKKMHFASNKSHPFMFSSSSSPLFKVMWTEMFTWMRVLPVNKLNWLLRSETKDSSKFINSSATDGSNEPEQRTI